MNDEWLSKLNDEWLSKLNEDCLIVNYMRAIDDPFRDEDIENMLVSTISIICDRDKQDYLNKIKEWQKESSLDEMAEEKKAVELREQYDMAWDDLLADLNPNDNRNCLKDNPILEVQFIDRSWYLVPTELLIKGNLDEFKDSEECIIVNHVRAYFGEREEGEFNESVYQNYFIKNNVALLCGEEKKIYIEKVEKSQREYLDKKERLKSTDEIHEITVAIWEDLEPPNKPWDAIPFLDVHNWNFYYDAILIELKGEIDHKWQFPALFPEY